VAKLSHNAMLLFPLIAVGASCAHAEEEAKRRGAFGVALQPFIGEHAQPIRVAYYVPPARKAEPIRRQPAIDDSLVEPGETLPRLDTSRPVVTGDRAVLRNGIAYAPARAPDGVKNAIWAVNTLRHKPYIWGGGHGSFSDYGYDCSGAVSFALHYAGLLATPLPSDELCRYGERGRGRWITIYSRPGHTFAVLAGLRLDTTDVSEGRDIGPRWYAYGRDTAGFTMRHPAGL